VVADDNLARVGLAALIAELEGYSVSGQTSGDEKLPDDVELFQPDIVVWDLGIDPSQPLQRLAGLREFSIPVLALVPDERAAGTALAQGARGVLPRNAGRSVLFAAADAVSRGLTVADPHFIDSLLAVREPAPEQIAESLTNRESEVLQLLAQGISNKAIASRLKISEHTVKFHVNSIMGKLGAGSRTEAVIRGMRMGLVKT